MGQPGATCSGPARRKFSLTTGWLTKHHTTDKEMDPQTMPIVLGCKTSCRLLLLTPSLPFDPAPSYHHRHSTSPGPATFNSSKLNINLSGRSHQLSVPRLRRSTFGTRAFSCCRTNSLEFTAWSYTQSSCWLVIIQVGPVNVSVRWTFKTLAH